MYADRVEAEGKRSVKERLYGRTADDFFQRRPTAVKRQRRDDDKWEHDLYADEPQLPNHNIGVRDLRLKLRKKGVQNIQQSGKGLMFGARDLRDKLSGSVLTRPVKKDVIKPKSVVEGSKPAEKAEAPPVETHKASNPAPKKKKRTESVNSFLKSLGLEKYSITFQAEEVGGWQIDMAALLHMSEDDLKALGLPMGPRKKIRLALDSGGN